MKKVKLIYNPFSGNASFGGELDKCLMKFLAADTELHIFRTSCKEDIQKHIDYISDKNYESIIIAGGDGTINIAVNAMLSRGMNVPIGIFPRGTANDIATFLNIPNDTEKCCDIILEGNTKKIDVGVVNGRCFLNVCGAGLFTNISQNIDTQYKNTLGKLAYYIKGIEQLPSFTAMPIVIKNSKETITENLYFYLILNGTGAGGFHKIAPNGLLDDGLLEFIGLKSCSLAELAVLFVKIFRGEHLDERSVVYFKDNYIKIEQAVPNPQFEETDVDGEAGPLMPVEISVIPQGINIYSNIK